MNTSAMCALIEKAVANQLAAISCPDSRFYSHLLSRDDSGVVLAGALTLLGLIIGFSFAMANEPLRSSQSGEQAEANGGTK